MAIALINNERIPENRDAGKLNKTAPTWLAALTPQLRSLTGECLGQYLGDIEEIRLRIGRPVIFRLGWQELTCDRHKKTTDRLEQGYIITRQELERNLEVLSQSSLYAWEDEFKNGYLTIPGGHRVGLAGRCVLDKGIIKTIKDVSGLNYRIGREVRGCADKIMRFIVRDSQIFHTLVVSPPQCGKTTLLRDMVRQLSDGSKNSGFAGVNIGLVDERSEIAGMYMGEPQFHVGLRTDVLDACPKAQGMIMLIRSMSPRVVATDELGKAEDIEALYQALQAGVTVLATVHGGSLREIGTRPFLRELVNNRFFQRIVVLSRRQGAGTLEAIYDGTTLERVG